MSIITMTLALLLAAMLILRSDLHLHMSTPSLDPIAMSQSCAADSGPGGAAPFVFLGDDATMTAIRAQYARLQGRAHLTQC
jgi:hypothetical protein